MNINVSLGGDPAEMARASAVICALEKAEAGDRDVTKLLAVHVRLAARDFLDQLSEARPDLEARIDAADHVAMATARKRIGELDNMELLIPGIGEKAAREVGASQRVFDEDLGSDGRRILGAWVELAMLASMDVDQISEHLLGEKNGAPGNVG